LGNEAAQYVIRSAVDPGRYMLSKMFTSFPSNLAAGRLPAVQAVCVLFDGSDGRPLAVIDGTSITHWRTAADSALGAKLLASPEPETMLVVGAGKMSWWLVQAHRVVRPSLARVLIWNRNQARASELADRLAQDGIRAEVVSDLDAATREADLISACTRSHTPLIKGAHPSRAFISIWSAATHRKRARRMTTRCGARAYSWIDAKPRFTASAISFSRSPTA
jgi:ornithine cyclodeaminase